MSSASFRGDGASVGFAEAIRRQFIRETWPCYGRASRSEFWYFWLFCALSNISSLIVFNALADLPAVNRGILGAMQTVVFVRRLHDVGRSGWWVLLTFTIVGIIPLLFGQ